MQSADLKDVAHCATEAVSNTAAAAAVLRL